MKNFRNFKKELLKNKTVAKEYIRLTPRYRIISEIISARNKTGVTQKELAEKIGTKQSAIARFENGGTNPTLKFLEKIAEVLGHRLIIQFQ